MPTPIIEGNAIFQMQVSENKKCNFFPIQVQGSQVIRYLGQKKLISSQSLFPLPKSWLSVPNRNVETELWRKRKEVTLLLCQAKGVGDTVGNTVHTYYEQKANEGKHVSIENQVTSLGK